MHRSEFDPLISTPTPPATEQDLSAQASTGSTVAQAFIPGSTGHAATETIGFPLNVDHEEGEMLQNNDLQSETQTNIQTHTQSQTLRHTQTEKEQDTDRPEQWDRNNLTAELVFTIEQITSQ